MSYFVYVLECADGSYYVGHCMDVDHRVKLHNDGQGAKHTRDHGPVKLVFTEAQPTKEAAVKRELQIKRWSRAKKEALIRGDTDELKRLSKRRST